ncbi:MAG: 2-amino-4-hydroxy-6-hydroxymethyldihydropteridine diphosphokinase [Coriobacteriia bacterium]|nr:2-amino-4-hydroxy-6-hydroxymethyldihydropteridine diphosphokinase [Coriobacteriia bacterium]
MAVEAYIGLGTNIGDRIGNIARALKEMDELEEVRLRAVSHVYESEPWGVPDQPTYANAAARIRTTLQADELLGRLQAIEAAMGRVPGERWGPRVIDLDILLFGDEEWASETLTIPHPRMGERDFVVHPLMEVAPKGLRYPDGRPVSRRGWLGRCKNDLGPVPGFEELSPVPAEGGELVCSLEEPQAPGPVVPGDVGQWRTIATTAGFGRLDTGESPLAFKESVLRDEGIPYAYDPHPPAGGFNPWGLGAQIKLKVPASEYERAVEAIRGAERERSEERS